MLIPVSITRSSLILKAKGSKSFVSTTFIAYFGEGREKLLNRKEWVLTSLLKDGEQSRIEPVIEHLSKDTCTLYYKDWSNNPILGDFKSDYPPEANFLMP